MSDPRANSDVRDDVDHDADHDGQGDPAPACLVRAQHLRRTYGSGATTVRAVVDVSVDIFTGEVVAVMGPSGCGKSTLLHLLGGLDRPDEGSVAVAGTGWNDLRGRRRVETRRRLCGYIFQNLALLPAATAYENVEIPLVLAGMAAAERAEAVPAMLEAVGMGDKGAHLPDQLSGGEQQRIGIARALVHEPALVLADEPTGSLDSATAQQIAELLVGRARRQGATVVLVTHDPRVAAHADRVLRLHSGQLAPDGDAAATEPGAGLAEVVG